MRERGGHVDGRVLELAKCVEARGTGPMDTRTRRSMTSLQAPTTGVANSNPRRERTERESRGNN